ncbi:unnamed protein product [Citrullus colocynthis]|uniref:Uncharacterized protein n=1 Tax=Citrullus colocynthis TaxID=252529 RepID=A0ABP0YVK3_9ROSI
MSSRSPTIMISSTVVTTFTRCRPRGVCIMSGNGTVTNVTLCQLAFLGSSHPFLTLSAPPPTITLTIYLVGDQGQIVNNNIVGTLISLPALSSSWLSHLVTMFMNGLC